jgi:long-chain acyl-CoA synthetase
MVFPTIPEMFLRVCNQFGDKKTVYSYKENDEYKDVHYEELREKVEALALALQELGIHSKDRIGIISENRLEWVIADLAITGIGAIDVPIFPTLTSKQEEFIFNDCGASAVVVSNRFQLNKILEVKDNIPTLRHIIVMNDDHGSSEVYVKTMNELIARGRELKSAKDRRFNFEKYARKVKPSDVLTIIYTSGTTGNPKGVVLTNENISSNVDSCLEALKFGPQDVFLSFLPLCHTYERTTGYYSALFSGATICFAESIETVGKNIMEVKPTLMTTVPKLLEVIKRKIYTNVSKQSPTSQKIFNWAVNTGYKKLENRDKGKNSMLLNLQYKAADKLVFSKIREKTGGRLRAFISGGAALPVDVCLFFLAQGIMIMEGYGLTEASPVISVNLYNEYEAGTVGKPLKHVEVKLAEDGEIMAKGPNVMKGYWNDPEATAKAIEDGWLYTGDVGVITERGNLKITDRKKNIFVNSGGKNIAPQPIENILCQSAYIEHCVLLGDKRDFVTALLTPDFEQIATLAETFGIEYNKVSELISHDQIIKTIKNDIDRLQKDFAKYERVRKFKLLSEPFTVENGELTPKMSIKRHVVERKYSMLIDQMYGLDHKE